MNDECFIEMLNLYMDRELVGEEIHEIEEAIASSPERQRIYAQYCKMQKATAKLLYETQVPQPHMDELVAAAETGSGNLVEFPSAGSSRSGWGNWTGALTGLAAACIAFVVYVGVTGNDAENSADIAGTTPQAPIVFSGNASTDESPYQTVFVLNIKEGDERLPGMRANVDSFAWMTQLQFAPIERTDLDAWEMKMTAPVEVRSLNTQWVSPENAPQAMTTFQFQR